MVARAPAAAVISVTRRCGSRSCPAYAAPVGIRGLLKLPKKSTEADDDVCPQHLLRKTTTEDDMSKPIPLSVARDEEPN